MVELQYSQTLGCVVNPQGGRYSVARATLLPEFPQKSEDYKPGHIFKFTGVPQCDEFYMVFDRIATEEDAPEVVMGWIYKSQCGKMTVKIINDIDLAW